MPHVAIVGAGPAGATLAHLLASRGTEVTLLERQSDFEREFRGEALQPSGLDALRQMGLGEAMAKTPSQAQRALSVFLNRAPVFSERLDQGALADQPLTVFSQPRLLEAIVAEAEKSPGFRLLRGASVKALHQEGGRVVGLRVRTSEGEQRIDADLVIGADGRASVVRRQAGFVPRSASPPLDVVWCKLARPADWEGVHLYAGRGHLMIAYHGWDDRLQLAWVILKGTFGELKQRGIEQWIEEMAGHVTPALGDHLRAHAGEVERPFLLDAEADQVERWSAPGALLIGDAAHTMSPVGGQGLNIALRDSVVAANHLVPALRANDPAAIAAACEAIERERRPEVETIQRLQAIPPKIMLNRAWWGEGLRRVVAALARREAVRRRIAVRGGEMAFGVTEVRLAV